MTRTKRPWWQATASPGTSFALAALWLVLGTGRVLLDGGLGFFPGLWLLLGLAYLASAIVLVRRDGWYRTEHRRRLLPFWPPDDR